jgi:NADH:ubiquinone oxidoreductase subunit E
MGQCKKWPNVKIEWEIHNYMNPAKAAELLKPKPKKWGEFWKKRESSGGKK